MGEWTAGVATFPTDAGKHWRGEIRSPWPPETGRLGVRTKRCAHRHRSPDAALKCADRMVRELEAERGQAAHEGWAHGEQYA